MRFARLSPIFAFILLLTAVPAAAPAQNTSPAQSPPLRSSTEIVRIDASIADARGQFVGGLQQSDFHVLDDGVEQPIALFTPVEAPSQILVLIETGPAVYLIHNEHLGALYTLLDGAAPNDAIGLAAYDQTPRLLLPFTIDRNAALDVIDHIEYSLGMGELNFYAAVSASLDWLGGAAGGEGRGKKSLLILATGLDTSPAGNWDRLLDKLHRQDAVIFTVALGASLRGGPKQKGKGQTPRGASPSATPAERTPFEKADDAMNALARSTGGRAYFPQNAGDFAAIYREIAAALRHQYVLGIRAAEDGQFHKLTVEVAEDKPGARNAHRVFVREGYIAPGP